MSDENKINNEMYDDSEDELGLKNITEASYENKEVNSAKKFISFGVPSVSEGSLIYICLTFLFLTLGYVTQSINIYFGIIFTEVVILGVVSYFIAKYKKYDMNLVFSLNRPKSGTILRSIGTMILLYPIVVFINGLFLTFITKFIPIPENLNAIPVPKSFLSFLVSIFLFACLPGIFEELIFRGILFRAFDKMQPWKRITLTAFLFGLFHYNPLNFIGPFILGIILGFIRYRSNSIVPSMFAHATNNSIAMFLSYILSDKAAELEMENEIDLASGLSTFTIVALVLLYIFMIYSVYKLLKNYPNYKENVSVISKMTTKEYIMIAVIIFISFAIMSYMVYALMHSPLLKN